MNRNSNSENRHRLQPLIERGPRQRGPKARVPVEKVRRNMPGNWANLSSAVQPDPKKRRTPKPETLRGLLAIQEEMSKYQENEFDRANWEEILKCGTKPEIAKRVKERFKDQKHPANRKYRYDHGEANALEYYDVYIRVMPEAGLLGKDGKPLKG